jgi:hypothetical protein
MNQTGLLTKYTVSSLLDECKKFYILKLKNGYKKNSEIPLRTRVIFELLCPGTIVKYGGKLGDVSAAIKKLQNKCGKLLK